MKKYKNRFYFCCDICDISLKRYFNIIKNKKDNLRYFIFKETITKIDGEITDEMILQGRDLSLYEKADANKECRTYTCSEKKQREFVWSHWQNKKRGYISSSISGIDFHNTEHIFIEPNEKGEWLIIWKMVRNDIFGNEIIETLGIISVNKNGRNKLEFKDKNGETLQTL
mgnify:CR=1 FL=1